MLQANFLKRIVFDSSECKAEEDLLYTLGYAIQCFICKK